MLVLFEDELLNVFNVYINIYLARRVWLEQSIKYTTSYSIASSLSGKCRH